MTVIWPSLFGIPGDVKGDAPTRVIGGAEVFADPRIPDGLMITVSGDPRDLSDEEIAALVEAELDAPWLKETNGNVLTRREYQRLRNMAAAPPGSFWGRSQEDTEKLGRAADAKSVFREQQIATGPWAKWWARRRRKGKVSPLWGSRWEK